MPCICSNHGCGKSCACGELLCIDCYLKVVSELQKETTDNWLNKEIEKGSP